MLEFSMVLPAPSPYLHLLACEIELVLLVNID